MKECKGYKAFADYIIKNINLDNVIEFATESEYDEVTENKFDYSGWYFVKLMKIEEYDSRFILIDYAGGEEAFVIPLSSTGGFDGNLFDSEDKDNILAYSKKLFNENISMGYESCSVWVDNDREVN